MKEKENIPKDSGFKIPESYFGKSFTSIKDRIELEKAIPSDSNNFGFKVPHDYFELNETILKNRIAFEQKVNGQLSQGFEVPDGYFEKLNFDINILSRKQNAPIAFENKKSKVITLKKYIYPAIAIAATFLLLFSVFATQDSTNGIESIEVASITEYFDKHDSTFYETDLEELLTEEDLRSLESDVAVEETLLIDYLEDRTDSYDFYMQ